MTDTVTILHAEHVEFGTRYLDRVRGAGILVTEQEELGEVGGFAHRAGALHSYQSSQVDRELWVIEIEGFDAPDAQWWRTLVLDGRPSRDAAVAQLGNPTARAGDRLASA